MQPTSAEKWEKRGSKYHSPAAPEGAERGGAAPARLARVLAWLVLPAIVLVCRDRSSAARLQSIAIIKVRDNFFRRSNECSRCHSRFHKPCDWLARERGCAERGGFMVRAPRGVIFTKLDLSYLG